MLGLRKITVYEQEYFWEFVFDEDDCLNDSFTLVKSKNKTVKLLVYFKKESWEHGFYPFNKGVQAIFNGQPILINLNQPRFIAEIVKYALDYLKVEDLVGTIRLDNGIEILHNLGYEFEYKKSLNN